jgi:hypothetical protein
MGSTKHVDAPHFSVCPAAKDATCTVGDLPTSQSEALLAAVRVGDDATVGEKIKLTATVKASKADSFNDAASVNVVAASTSTSDGSASSSTSSIGDDELPPGISLPDGSFTNTSPTDPSGLFPTVSPTSGSSGHNKKPGKNADATTVSATLPLDSRLIGGQLAGLAVLASAIAIAIARLSLRAPKTPDGGGTGTAQ